MRLTIVGCSGSFPGPDSAASCYLLEAEGFRLVLDLGSGALGPLQRHASLDEIDAVCLSHLHADHCLDLCGYWVARTYHPDGPRPRMPVHGPAGAGRRMAQAYGLPDPPGMTEAFAFETLSPGATEIGPLRLTLARMNHPVETFGFRIEHAGRALAYSADTAECPELVDLARGADLLLCEASYLTGPGLPAGLHLTGRQAAEHAARAGAGALVLTHLVPWNDPARMLEEAAAAPFRGPIALASPGQSFVLDLAAFRHFAGRKPIMVAETASNSVHGSAAAYISAWIGTPAVLRADAAEAAPGPRGLARRIRGELADPALPTLITNTAISVSRSRRRMRMAVAIQMSLCVLVLGLSVLLMGRYGITGVGAAWLIAQAATAAALIALPRLWLPSGRVPRHAAARGGRPGAVPY